MKPNQGQHGFAYEQESRFDVIEEEDKNDGMLSADKQKTGTQNHILE